MEEAKSELSRIIQDREMRNVVLLVFANKQDVDGGKPQIAILISINLTDTNHVSPQPCDPTM